MALAHYLASRYDKALEYATLVVQLRPDWWLALMIYAALAATRKIREARSICADLNRVRPDMTIHALADLPFARQIDREHMARSLGKAGLRPE
jgi:hypothetical protein